MRVEEALADRVTGEPAAPVRPDDSAERPSPAAPAHDGVILVGRQPIVDVTYEVVGYELLFRAPDGEERPSADEMTRRVIEGTIFSVGFESLVGERLAFLNASTELVCGDVDLPFPPAQTVIEIPADLEVDDDVLRGCRHLRARGYRLALDGVRRPGQAARLAPLADMAKVDLLGFLAEGGPAPSPRDPVGGSAPTRTDSVGTDSARLEAVVDYLRACGLRLVALRIETPGELDLARRLNFDYYQGFLLGEPEVQAGRELSPTQASCLRLASRLADPNLSTAEVERILRSDAGLAYRVLRLASVGAAHGMRRPVTSLREAVVLLGRQRLVSLVTLVLLAGDAPSASALEHVRTAAIRARTTELVAEGIPGAPTGEAFLAGLLSSLERLLHTPLSEALADFPLDPAITDAVVGHRGPIGELLELVIDHEMGRVSVGDTPSAQDLERSYLEAIAWAAEIDAPAGA